jgi:hypothetical protein
MKLRISSLQIKSKEVWSFKLKVKELKDQRFYIQREK